MNCSVWFRSNYFNVSVNAYSVIRPLPSGVSAKDVIAFELSIFRNMKKEISLQPIMPGPGDTLPMSK